MYTATATLSDAPIALLIITSLLAYISYCVVRHLHCGSGMSKSTAGGRAVSTMVIFGSGGHTTEMLHMIRNLTVTQISPIYFVTAHSDQTSMDKIQAFNLSYANVVQWQSIFRSREVKQSWGSSVFTFTYALLQAARMVLVCRPQLIICNGPGTCVPLCLIASLLRFVSAQHYCPRLVFAESFCRVESLSLTGKILYPVADTFIVQWPGLVRTHPKARYIGKIC